MTQRLFAAGAVILALAVPPMASAAGLVIQMDGLHGRVNALRGQVAAAVEQVRGQLSSIELACRGLALWPETTACGNLLDQKQRFASMVTPLQSSFDDAEAAYQDAIAQASERQHLLRNLIQ